jgi:hypothetical protein
VRLDGERWRTFFDAFQHTAFRLETYTEQVGHDRQSLADARRDLRVGLVPEQAWEDQDLAASP